MLPHYPRERGAGAGLYEAPEITSKMRLQLLKSTNKYKPKFEPAVGGSNEGPPHSHDQYGDNTLIVSQAGNTTQTQTMNYT